MGAWGAGSFDNDDALDWLDALEERGRLAIEDALRAAAEAGESYLEAPEASIAVAAAEVAAALHGRPAADLPGEVEAWVKLNPAPGADLRELARAAVRRVRQESELRELWEETDPADWYAALDDLLRRLG